MKKSTCYVCGRQSHVENDGVRVYCICGNSYTAKGSTDCYLPDSPLILPINGPTAWHTIHTRYSSGEYWDSDAERRWYETKWLPTIPSYGCKCREDWAELTKQHPIDFRTRYSAFKSLWFLHNKVNEKLGKPTITLENATNLYGENKCESND